ncbi:MAG: hypothetical protein ABEI77_08405 [Halorientalis sp.]
MRLSVRLVGIVVLGLLLFGVCSHVAAVYDSHWSYPTANDLATEYNSHVGEQVFLFGRVQQTNRSNGTMEIRVQADDGSFPLTVSGTDATVEPGGDVQVYGTIREDRRVSAEQIVVVNQRQASRLYKYAVSLVGAGLVVVAFFRQWQVDRDELGFEVR